jgi:signal transduction histidine kinase
MKRVARNADVRLVAYVALGAGVGFLFVVFDLLSEARIGRGTLTGFWAGGHAVVDHVAPVLVGALLGICAHYGILRARLSAAEEAASRAEALGVRLSKVERDQAVWVLAAAVLHELNNPLHAIGLLLDELSRCEGDAALQANLAARARAQADRALAHLAALRSMRTAGEPELERVALDRILGTLAGELGPLAAEQGLAVRVQCERAVQASADPAYVRTILENLVDNSLSSLRDHGRGQITLKLDAEEGRAVVRVFDDGPPVDPQVKATLFEPLRSTKTQGLGLGLPIARALARAMRGELSLEDANGKAFRLELPLQETS